MGRPFFVALPHNERQAPISNQKQATLVSPAWVTVEMTGRVEPSVNNSGEPSAPRENLSTIACGNIRSV